MLDTDEEYSPGLSYLALVYPAPIYPMHGSNTNLSSAPSNLADAHVIDTNLTATVLTDVNSIGPPSGPFFFQFHAGFGEILTK